jgi:hypothetical protein
MIGLGITLLLALAALAAQHVYWRGGMERLNAHWQARYDEETGRLADDLANAQHDATEAEIQRDAYAAKVDELARGKAQADVDLEWARIVIAAQGLEIDRHFLLPTIAGKRAEHAARDNVVPLRPKAGA